MYLFEREKQNNSDNMDFMVEKISQPNDESSIAMKIIKNSTDLFIEGSQLCKNPHITIYMHKKKLLIPIKIKLRAVTLA